MNDEDYVSKFRKQIREEFVEDDKNFLVAFREKRSLISFSNLPEIHQVILKDDFKKVKYLIKNKENLNKTDEYMETPLHLAVRRGYESVVSLLISHGADLNRQNQKGLTPLGLAVRWGTKKILSLLMEAGADVTLKDNNGYTPLILAADLGYTSKMKILLDHPDVDKEAVDNKGRTALMRASKNGYFETVFTLLMQGAKVLSQDIYGKSAIDYADERGFAEILRLLRYAGKKELEEKALISEGNGFVDISERHLYFDEKNHVFVAVRPDEKKKKQVFQVVSNGKEVFIKPVKVAKSDLKKAGFQAVLLNNLMRQKN